MRFSTDRFHCFFNATFLLLQYIYLLIPIFNIHDRFGNWKHTYLLLYFGHMNLFTLYVQCSQLYYRFGKQKYAKLFTKHLQKKNNNNKNI
jgi:hypothetical protein